MNFSLKALIGKLNAQTRNAVEAAAGLCMSRTHYDVEVEHYLSKLLDQDDGDAAAVFDRPDFSTSPQELLSYFWWQFEYRL